MLARTFAQGVVAVVAMLVYFAPSIVADRRGRRGSARVVELLGDAEPGGAGSRIGRELSGIGLDRLAAEEEKRGPVSAGAVGLLGRT